MEGSHVHSVALIFVRAFLIATVRGSSVLSGRRFFFCLLSFSRSAMFFFVFSLKKKKNRKINHKKTCYEKKINFEAKVATRETRSDFHFASELR